MSIIPSSSTAHAGFLNLVPNDASKSFPGESEQKTVPSKAMSFDENAGVARPACPSASTQASRRVRGSSSTMPTATDGGQRRKLHRIAEVRVSQGISERTLCRRLHIDIKQLRALEDPTSEMPLSILLEIQEALDVPFADLLVESEGLARPVHERAKLLKIMKTAVSIKECNLPPRPSRLAQMLNEQLIELMPELADVGGWPEFGSRRGSGSIARILTDEIDTSNLGRE